jgi:cytochrome c peroxidase
MSFFTTGHVMAFDVLQPLPNDPIIPSDNPLSKEKIALGKQLFFDRRLSKNGQVSCMSCHNLAAGGDDDGAAKHISSGRLKRSAPSVWNAAYMSTYYWDARATSLEAQTIDHLLDPEVMGMDKKLLQNRLSKIPGYKTAFAQTFRTTKGVLLEDVAKAIASFERSLKTPDSAFDRYIRGDKNAISERAKRGLKIYTDIGCLSCHFGVNFSGPAPGPALKMGDGFYELFPNHLGSEYDKKYGLTDDVGRYLITLQRTDIHMWRVPPLRNIALTAPYFHNGSVAQLEEAVRVMAWVQLKTRLNDQDVNDIVAFLKTLTGKIPEVALPHLPETDGLSLMLNP